jgi:prophage regulatory protein
MSTKPLDRILREPEVKRVTGLSRTTRWRGVKAGTFPPPVEPTPGTRGWFESVIARWQAELRAKAELSERNTEHQLEIEK